MQPSVGQVNADTAQPRRKSDGAAIPLRIPGQAQVILNVATRQTTAKSDDLAFRVVQIVPSFDHARTTVPKHSQYNQFAFYTHPVHTWKLLSHAQRTDAETIERIQHIYGAAMDRAAAERARFEQYCRERREAAAATDDDFETQQARLMQDTRASQTYDVEVGGLSTCEPDDQCQAQRFAAVGIINGPEADTIVSVYAAFPTLEECRRYVQDTLVDEYDGFDISCVDTNQWIYPHLAADRRIRRGYRHQKLDDIMTHKQNEQATVAKYKKACEKTAKEVRFVDVGGATKTPG